MKQAQEITAKLINELHVKTKQMEKAYILNFFALKRPAFCTISIFCFLKYTVKNIYIAQKYQEHFYLNANLKYIKHISKFS